jgi:hypothetical protein
MIKKASPTHAATVNPPIIITAVEFSPGCMNRFRKKSFTVPAMRVVIVEVAVEVSVSWAEPESKGGIKAIISLQISS